MKLSSIRFDSRLPSLVIVVTGLLAATLLPSTATAQLDRVYTYDSTTATSGTITDVSRNGIQLRVGGNSKDFKENEIRKVLLQGDPSGLTRGRELALDGQYAQAIEQLETIDTGDLPRDIIKAEVEFYRFLSRAKLALAGQGDRKAAVNEGINFAKTHGNSFHFFAVAKLLGDLELANQSYDGAVRYYSALSRSPSTETKIESRYLVGVANLEKGELDTATSAFSAVAAVDVNSTQALRLKQLALAGNAVAMARSGNGKEGLELAEKLIAELNPTDIEMSAKIYNAQGASYEATGDIEGAILAYLHTHLMFSSQSDAHATALRRLVELWPKVGRAERAAAARQELQQRYPGLAN